MNSSCKNNYIRKLTSEDEGQFIQLLKAVYKDTYSYEFFYEPGGFSSLINKQTLNSYGEFDSNHRLLAHTGFWHLEHSSDYIESGCSFRMAAGSSKFKTNTLPGAWEECLNELALEHAFIHQQCTTLHSLAQRYARQFMRAKPCGIIVNYAQNELIRGVESTRNRMHALMMTSVLQPDSIGEKTVYIPEAFQSWLSSLYDNLNLPRIVIAIKPDKAMTTDFNLISFETNPYISLQRRLVVPPKETRSSDRRDWLASQTHNKDGTKSNSVPYRTDLIHLPLESSSLVHSVLPMLLDAGYMPCGLRPHVNQSDELILQNLVDYHDIVLQLMGEIKIADKNTKLWIELWQKLILQIM